MAVTEAWLQCRVTNVGCLATRCCCRLVNPARAGCFTGQDMLLLVTSRSLAAQQALPAADCWVHRQLSGVHRAAAGCAACLAQPDCFMCSAS